MSKIRIDVEEVIRLQLRRNEINAPDIRYVEFYKDGEKIDVPDDELEEWRFVGLSNTDFVMMVLKNK